MIRKFNKTDISEIMKLWLETNIQTHDYVSKEYWLNHYESVKLELPQAEVWVYEIDKEICGFIGVIDNYVAGIFVKKDKQSKGIGKEMFQFIKNKKNELSLNVYMKNERAIQFYMREGFVVKNKQKDEETGLDDYLMCWVK